MGLILSILMGAALGLGIVFVAAHLATGEGSGTRIGSRSCCQRSAISGQLKLPKAHR
jgi:hypothetical protein